MQTLCHFLLFAVACAAKVPKALLINLPRHRARYESVKEQFEVQNVRFLRAPACDGKLLTDEQMKQNVTALGRLLMTRGMVGCFLSHRSCWQKCVEMGEPVLVFEDDGASLIAAFQTKLNDEALSHCPCARVSRHIPRPQSSSPTISTPCSAQPSRSFLTIGTCSSSGLSVQCTRGACTRMRAAAPAVARTLMQLGACVSPHADRRLRRSQVLLDQLITLVYCRRHALAAQSQQASA